MDLLAIDVTVVDDDGRPVRGLAADDFVVSVAGARVPVRALDYREFVSGRESMTVRAYTTASARVPATAGASRGGRVILILIDDLSTKPGDGTGLRVGAQRMLASTDPDDLVGLVTTSGLGPVVSPTRDRTAIAAALEHRGVVGRNDDSAAPFFITVPEAVEVDRDVRGALSRVARRECAMTSAVDCPSSVESAARRLARHAAIRSESQAAAYVAVIEALRAAPAPRVIIALSAGLALRSDRDASAELTRVANAAAAAGVQFYALTEVADGADARDTAEPGCLPPGCITRSVARMEESRFLASGLQSAAAAAGGEAFLVVGQSDRFLTRILRETQAVYRLGVGPTAASTTTPFLDVKVEVDRPGVTVRTHRRVAASVAVEPPASPEDALRARLAQGGAAFGVPITLQTRLRRSSSGSGFQAAVGVTVPGTVPGPLLTMYALVNASGQIVQNGRHTAPAAGAGRDYWMSFPVSMSSGAFRLRVAVADATGNVGSVQEQFTPGLTSIGSIPTSDLFLLWSDGQAPPHLMASETLPAEASRLRASLELYPVDPMAGEPIRVEFALMPVGTTSAVVTKDVQVTAQGAGWLATVDMPIDRLSPGRYSVQATVYHGAVAIGRISASVRKQG